MYEWTLCMRMDRCGIKRAKEMEIPDYGDRSKNLRYLYASVSNPSGRTGEESVGERAEEAKTLPSQSLSQSVSQPADQPTSQPSRIPPEYSKAKQACGCV